MRDKEPKFKVGDLATPRPFDEDLLGPVLEIDTFAGRDASSGSPPDDTGDVDRAPCDRRPSAQSQSRAT